MTYICKFQNGTTAKATFSKDPPSMNIEWSDKPKRKLIPEYLIWRREMVNDFTRRTGLRILIVDLAP